MTIALALVCSCAARQPPAAVKAEPSPTPRARSLPAGTFVVVSKNRRTLTVYRDGKTLSQCNVVFGLHPQGPKRFEGDMRTPEGLYHVVETRQHPRWRYFIALDYPNEADRAAYRRDRRAGLIPVIERRVLPIGGAIGIHGSDHPREQRAGIDWTKGCIAMNNGDIARLARMLEPGVPVLIEP